MRSLIYEGSKSVRKIHSAVERKAVLERYFERKGVDLAYTEERKEVMLFTKGSVFQGIFDWWPQNMIEATGIGMHNTGYRDKG